MDFSKIKEAVRKQFYTTPRSPSDKVEFPMCTRCGQILRDNLRTTLDEHLQEMHNKTRKEKIFTVTKKWIWIVVFVGIVGGFFFYIDSRSSGVFDECDALIYDFNIEWTIAKEIRGISPEEVESYNELTEKCNVTFEVRKLIFSGEWGKQYYEELED